MDEAPVQVRPTCEEARKRLFYMIFNRLRFSGGGIFMPKKETVICVSRSSNAISSAWVAYM